MISLINPFLVGGVNQWVNQVQVSSKARPQIKMYHAKERKRSEDPWSSLGQHSDSLTI
ncbi:hypothetical protein HNQ42_000571 [Rummeliibacillus stabekisii]|nr:hypothetical protein [Rummeliibacillus stabekisii]GEL03469.1 hypothetical protein RST01_00960 [Rummeliibacillus stabekisii]